MEAHLLEELRRLEAAAVHLLCRAAAAESRFRGGDAMRRRGGGGALLCCSSPRCGEVATAGTPGRGRREGGGN